MGVSGSGKTTLGVLIAQRLDVPFVDGDDLHSPENRSAMAAGRALTDEQRLPWLREVGRALGAARGEGTVVACSALRRSYRDVLREAAPDLFVVYAAGSYETIQARVSGRQHEFMPASLLRSQFAALEERQDDEWGITVSIERPPEAIVDDVAAALGSSRQGGHRAGR